MQMPDKLKSGCKPRFKTANACISVVYEGI